MLFCQVLNQFMTQIEQLEKTIDINEIAKNGNVKKIVRESERKDSRIGDLEAAIQRQRTEADATKCDLKNKNEEIESILLNLVSKETFIRTQFQKLQNEIKVLKAEKEQSKEMEEQMVEMKKEVRGKEEEVEDMREEVKSTQALVEQSRLEMRKLQDKSTKIIGDITKGIGAKLAEAKSTEATLKDAVERAAVLEENFKEMFTKYEQAEKAKEKQAEEFKELKEAAQTVSKELKATNQDLLSEGLLLKEENGKLKEQQVKLTKKFRMKVKDIQETLSNFNEKMKEKNSEIGILQSAKEAQTQDLEKLKEEAKSREQRIVVLKERESDLMADLEAERSMRIEYPEENEAAVEKNVIANESGFFLIESNDDDDEGKKSESFAKKTKSRPIEAENEKYEEDPFEEEFDVEQKTSSEVKKEKVEDEEKDAEEPRSKTNCSQKRKKNLESENDEKRLCIISLPLNKDRTLNKNMKISTIFKKRIMRKRREDLRTIKLFKDSTLKPFPLLHFSPQNIGSFSFSWPIVPYVPNRILEHFHKQIDNL